MDTILRLGLQVIQFVVYYFVPPIMLLAVLAYTTFITFTFRGRPLEYIPRVVGYLVGFLLLISAIVLKIDGYLDFQQRAQPLGLWDLGLFGTVGFLMGFFLLLLIQLLVRTRVAGFLIAALVGGASISLFFFVFIGEVRDILVVGVVAFLIGVGIYGMLFPEAIRRAFGR